MEYFFFTSHRITNQCITLNDPDLFLGRRKLYNTTTKRKRCIGGVAFVQNKTIDAKDDSPTSLADTKMSQIRLFLRETKHRLPTKKKKRRKSMTKEFEVCEAQQIDLWSDGEMTGEKRELHLRTDIFFQPEPKSSRVSAPRYIYNQENDIFYR